jgi:hypothetical protein
MTTSVSKTTPQSAPRDAQGLMKLGIFALRLLIIEAGGLASNDEKMAFAKMSVDEKVVLAQQLLANYDRTHGTMPMNGAGNAAPMMPPPQQQPMQQQPMFQQPLPSMQVDPASVAAAAQAAAPQQPAPTQRKPRNAAAQAAQEAAPDLGAEVIVLLTRIAAQNDEANGLLAAGLKDVLAQVSEGSRANAENASNYKAVYGALGVMNTALANVQFQTKLAMSLVLPLAEQVLGASREQILQAAVGDVDVISQLLAQMANPGKG